VKAIDAEITTGRDALDRYQTRLDYNATVKANEDKRYTQRQVEAARRRYDIIAKSIDTQQRKIEKLGREKAALLKSAAGIAQPAKPKPARRGPARFRTQGPINEIRAYLRAHRGANRDQVHKHFIIDLKRHWDAEAFSHALDQLGVPQAAKPKVRSDVARALAQLKKRRASPREAQDYLKLTFGHDFPVARRQYGLL